MAFGESLKNKLKSMSRDGEVNGSVFPFGTYINFRLEDSEEYMIFIYPNKEEERITHDKVKCATILAMGVSNKNTSSGTKVSVGGIDGYATIIVKYLCVLKDGRQAVITVDSCKNQYKVEKVLF